MKTNRFITIFTIAGLLFFEVNSQNIYTFAGNGTSGFSGDGDTATKAQLYNPEGLAVDAAGNVLIADAFNYRIRKVNTSLIISTIAGSLPGDGGDGGPAANAQLSIPVGVCYDATGNIYIVDRGKSRVRKIDTNGIITAFAGNSNFGYTGDGGPAINATMDNPAGICIDPSGNIYIADKNNNVIRKVNTSGIISTFAGNGTQGFGGDGGPASSAQLDNPRYVTADPSGNIYITDNNYRIRKVNTAGVISTFAGTGNNGFSGDGGPAINADINGGPLAADNAGNIYFGDLARIRKINTSGTINTIIGTGVGGYGGDGGPAINATIQPIGGIALDASNNIYFSDKNNQRVREVCVSSCYVNVNTISKAESILKIFPNPNNGNFNVRIDGDFESGYFILYNILGVQVYREKIFKGENSLRLSALPKGLYYSEVYGEGKKVGISKLAIE